MYKHGKPIYKLSHRPAVIITLLLLVCVAAGFYFVSKNTKDSLNNNAQARVTVIKDKQQNNTAVDEPIFQMTLPGPWKLASVDWDARYHAYQWSTQDQKFAGRWFRVYVDTIPRDQAVNYLLPIKIEDNTMILGSQSDNCVNFTKGATPQEQRPVNIPLSMGALPARWELVDFLCDNANVNQQVVGAASNAGLNTVRLAGPTKGAHNFFFMYRDNNISPDYGIMDKVLATFSVK